MDEIAIAIAKKNQSVEAQAEIPANRYIRYAELELYYDCPFEYTPNGFAADDDYYYVAIIARIDLPSGYEKTRILKFSRTTYRLVDSIEGDFGHANTLCVDKDNHLLYSSQLFKYYLDENNTPQTQILTGIDVFDVSGDSIVYSHTIQTDKRSASVAFCDGQLYMYYQSGEIYTVNTATGVLSLYCTMPVVTRANTQSIEMDSKYIYWLSYSTSAVPEEGNIAVYTHAGKYLGQITVNSVMPNVGYLGELEDLWIEGDTMYISAANVDRTEAAPYNNMRQVVVIKTYLSDVLPNRSIEYDRERQYNPQSWGSVTIYVDKNTAQYHPLINKSANPFKSIRAALRFLMFQRPMNYFISIAPGTYSETLKFESIGARRFRFARNGSSGEVILNKQITIYDGEIEFRDITFDVSTITTGIIKLMNSFRLEPAHVSLYSCKFDAAEMISASDTVYGVYSEYPYGASVTILQDSYTTNAANVKHYLPYCHVQSWQRPNDRFTKDICNLNGGYMAHTRIDATNLDLDDFFNPGTYMITAGGSANHIPSGSNGWLIVLSQPLYGSYYKTLTKQIWLRMGTAGKTDNVIMFRTYGSGAWGPWYEVALKEGAMQSGTTLTIGRGIFTGFITGSKKSFSVTIPLNVAIPSNLSRITASNWSFTMRNNGTSITSININDTDKVASYSAVILPSTGVLLNLTMADDFVTNSMSNFTNNDPTIMYIQGDSASLTFTDPNVSPDTPDSPSDSGQVTPDPNDGSTPIGGNGG